jgi:hypothetical protein
VLESRPDAGKILLRAPTYRLASQTPWLSYFRAPPQAAKTISLLLPSPQRKGCSRCRVSAAVMSDLLNVQVELPSARGRISRQFLRRAGPLLIFNETDHL